MIRAYYEQISLIEVKRPNQQMNRNKNRFPEDFCFQLNSVKFKNQRSQNATFKRECLTE